MLIHSRFNLSDWLICSTFKDGNFLVMLISPTNQFHIGYFLQHTDAENFIKAKISYEKEKALR